MGNQARHSAVYRAAWRAMSDATGGSIESRVCQAIADALETALEWPPRPPVPPEGQHELRGRWSCGCDMAACAIRWDVFSDASANPSQVLRVTCVTHGLVGDSNPAPVAANEGMRQRQRALLVLDLAHQEQCR